jgi:hypothetical protein
MLSRTKQPGCRSLLQKSTTRGTQGNKTPEKRRWRSKK